MQSPSKINSRRPMYVVRPPLPGDYDGMAQLAGQLGYSCTADEIKSRVTEMLDLNQHAVYIAELPGGQVAGWIGLHVFRSVEQEGCAGISGLIVDEQIRSRGIGKLLLEAAENWARKQCCNAISVHSNVTRERAHRFYRNNGYQHIKTQQLLHKAL